MEGSSVVALTGMDVLELEPPLGAGRPVGGALGVSLRSKAGPPPLLIRRAAAVGDRLPLPGLCLE